MTLTRNWLLTEARAGLAVGDGEPINIFGFIPMYKTTWKDRDWSADLINLSSVSLGSHLFYK